MVGNLLVRAQVKSEPSPSDGGSGDSGRPASSGSIHSVLPSVSVSSRILPLSTSPSPFNFGPTGPLSLGISQHGLSSRDQDRAGSGRSSSNSGMGSPHSTPPPSIGSSQSDTSVGSSLHSTQYIKKEPQVSSTVPPQQTYSGQKFHENHGVDNTNKMSSVALKREFRYSRLSNKRLTGNKGLTVPFW